MSLRYSVLCLVFAGCAVSSAPASSPVPLSESPAQCLARKEVRLYGAPWCHYCQEQLTLFGADASEIRYVDCDPNGTLDFKPECAFLGELPSFPIWAFPDGSRLVGVRHPAVIASVADCPYP